MYYDLNDLDWVELGGTGWRRAAVQLDDEDTAVNPASTKHVLYGPGWVQYNQAPDGGVTATIIE